MQVSPAFCTWAVVGKGSEKTAAAFWTSGYFIYYFAKATLLFRKEEDVVSHSSFIDRINEVNPSLNCVVAHRFEEAKKEARKVDELIESGLVPEEKLAKDKPFLGVPFSTKDCIPIKGLIHSSGLVKRKHLIASEDAKVVASLREAGAIPLALTNVSELCMWWESANNVHGRTNNPPKTNLYNQLAFMTPTPSDLTAVRIEEPQFNNTEIGPPSFITNEETYESRNDEGEFPDKTREGIGSDIGGSIRMPSFFNGVFGHKPSPGVVPNHGQYPEPLTEEQARFLGLGPICRRAEDLLPIMKVIVDVKKLRWFYQDTDSGSIFISPVSGEIRELFTKISKHLEKAYTMKMTKVNYKKFSKSAPMWLANMKSPCGPTFQEQLANLNGSINPWWELVKWVLRLSEHTFIGIVTCFAENWGTQYGDEKYKYLVEQRDALRRELTDLLGDDGVFLYPTHPTSAPYHNEPLVKPFNFSYTAVINVLGFPSTHCPMGLDKKGLPIGVQVVAADGNDRLCLAVAREIERAFGGWVPPTIEA
ncbi:unnamed protein product [Phaedon cochleariae]|uniref:Amidase domain-containing protein n=1 Tax=Phaedon cochleariae TaxID=80249 RepID=A0A9N9SGD2_PHACE|nr:unnamed protein product [Phaedon cochleariae]